MSASAWVPRLEFTAAGVPPGPVGQADLPVLLAADIASTTGVELVEFVRDGATVHTLDPRGTQRVSRQLLRVTWPTTPEEPREGYIEVLDNEIQGAEPYGLPPLVLRPLGSRRLGWTASPGVGCHGVTLRLRSSHAGLLQFSSGQLQLVQPLYRFSGRRMLVAGRVALSRLSEVPPPRELQVTWYDRPAPGRHHFWVQVTEADGRVMISEPVCLTVRG